jgi:hypothetical protein
MPRCLAQKSSRFRELHTELIVDSPAPMHPKADIATNLCRRDIASTLRARSGVANGTACGAGVIKTCRPLPPNLLSEQLC